MRFLRKERGVDVLDLTLLQRKGLLHAPVPRSAEIIDLTMPQLNPRLPSHSSPSEPPLPATPLVSFFDLPNSGASSEASATPVADNPFSMLDNMSTTGSTSSMNPGMSNSIDPASFNALKIKIDDLEFKIDRLVEKFSLLDERLRS